VRKSVDQPPFDSKKVNDLTHIYAVQQVIEQQAIQMPVVKKKKLKNKLDQFPVIVASEFAPPEGLGKLID
jgi:hypothetical protein